MKVIIYGESEDAQNLQTRIRETLEDLGLTDFIVVETTTDDAIKNTMNISEDSALIIEEESIDFKDMIFEGLVPEHEELKSMFVSIIGWGAAGGGCSPGPGGCGDGCSC